MTNYVASLNGTDWPAPDEMCSDREKVVAMMREAGHTHFYTGMAIPRTIADYVDGDRVLEEARDHAMADLGEIVWEYWEQPEVTEAAEQELREFLEGWAKRHGFNPPVFAVSHVQEHGLPSNSQSAESSHK